MKKKPYVSVIITTYNSESFITRCINSVINQSYKNFEIIVVDDCSSDKTLKILNELKKKFAFKIIKLKKNSGSPGKPRNIGIKNSSGKVVAFLDADDYWKKNKLSEQIKYYKKNHINCSNTQYFDYKNRKTPFLINFLRLLTINIFIFLINKKKSLIFLFNPIVLSSALISKSAFRRIQFSEKKNIAGIEDLLLWFKIISEIKYEISFINKTLVNNFKRRHSLHSDYFFQIIKSVNIISGLKLENKIKATNFLIIFTILIKLAREVIKFFLIIILKNKKKILILVSTIYFISFYSPLFNELGKPLLYSDNNNSSYKKSHLVVVNTNYGYDKYFNFGFNYRLEDLIINFNNFKDKKILLLGNEKYIPQKLILKGLLINNGFNPDNIIIVLNKIKSKKEEIFFLIDYSKKNNLKNISYFTSPYNTKLTKEVLNLQDDHDINFEILKSSDWPKENHPYFTRFSYKKMIITEYFKILLFKLDLFFSQD